MTALETMGANKLQAAWWRVYRASPTRLTRDLLARGVAYILQAKVFGGLDVKVEQNLVAVAKRTETGTRLKTPVIKRRTRPKRGCVRHSTVSMSNARFVLPIS